MTIGLVRQVNIDQEMRAAYLDYAMSVIVQRALPDARDGLKPVHRRILYAMYDMGLTPDKPHRKSARIVGEVLGKYHPHGDTAVYEAMVRMAQDFSMRYVLIDGQGNFGSIDGDSAAAMRYTEARMSPMGLELLTDIQKETVDFADNFDGSLQEPTVLPSSIPNLLVNGSSGIAVGMSTSIPPHNLGEVCDALVYMLQNWAKLDDVGISDLMQFVKGPDFPTGGIVYRVVSNGEEDDALMSAYSTGRGKVTVRAKVHLEDIERGRSRIIVSELPYLVNKTTLIERIADLAREGQIEGLSDLRDESDRQGLRIVIELSRTAEPEQVLSQLFKLTPLQITFSIIMLALVDNEPRMLSLKQALKVYIDHRLVVIRRRSEYDLARAKERAHVLEGLLTALDNLDAVIALIRRSRTVDTARANLQKEFKLSEIQAQAILDMPLRRLAALERKKLEDEYKELRQRISYLEKLLKNPKMMRDVLGEELSDVKTRYADPRRTVIVGGPATDVKAGDLLMPNEDTWVALSADGLIYRSYQNEPPKVTGSVKAPPRALLASNTAHTLYLFTAKGEAATIPVQQLPQANELGEGVPFSDICPLDKKAEITAALSLPPNGALEGTHLFLAATDGDVKRIRNEDLPRMTAKAFTVMNVNQGAKLGWVFLSRGDDEEVILVTGQGQAIRFKTGEVRPTGLPAGGMRGVKLLGQRDRVIAAGLSVEKKFVWSITDTGVAKCTPVAEYPTQGRGGSGVVTMKLPEDAIGLTAGMIGGLDDNLIVVTNKGKAKYMRVGLAPKSGRNTKGDYVISLRGGEAVSGVVTYQPKLGGAQGEPEKTVEIPQQPVKEVVSEAKSKAKVAPPKAAPKALKADGKKPSANSKPAPKTSPKGAPKKKGS